MSQDSFWTLLRIQKESCVAVLCLGGGLGSHPGSSVTHIWKHSGGGWLLSWSRVPANCLVGIGHTHTHTQKIYCVCPGEAEHCNGATSGCGWQTDWQAGRHGDPLSWKESVHLCHALHPPHLSVCPSPCLFPFCHRLFLPFLILVFSSFILLAVFIWSAVICECLRFNFTGLKESFPSQFL